MHAESTLAGSLVSPLDGSADPRAREADRLEDACAWRQPGDPLDGRQRRGRPGPRRQPQARKDKSTERIDGIVALIMAIGRALVTQEELYVSYQLIIL
jgi:hypothetical protein